MKKTILTMAMLAFTLLGNAQQNLFGGKTIVSPEVNPDNTVTFRLKAPKAKKVQVSGDFLKPITIKNPQGGTWDLPGVAEMVEKDGVWSFTSDKLNSEFYMYNFIVEGLTIHDPVNVYLNRDVSMLTNYFIIKDGKDSKGHFYSVNDVPHGSVTRLWYDSPTLKMKRRMTVYTPAGYDKGGKYPVLYLLHGAGGDEEAWITQGRTAQILDNLIAEGKAKPMIVVMTNGNPTEQAAPGETQAGLVQPSMAMGRNKKPVASFEESFPDVMKYIESNYRVLKDKRHTAICGLSMGGGHSVAISKRYPTRFDYVGIFSAGLFQQANPKASEEEKAAFQAKLDKEFAAQFKNAPKLYWIGCGKTDFVMGSTKALTNYFDKHNYKYEYVETDGGHIWRNWRIYLSEFAPKLFK